MWSGVPMTTASIDLALLVEHLPEVFVLFGVGPLVEAGRAALPVDVGERDDVFDAGPGVFQIAERLSAAPMAARLSFSLGDL